MGWYYEKKTVAFLRLQCFSAGKNQVDSRVFSLAPNYYLHPCKGSSKYLKTETGDTVRAICQIEAHLRKCKLTR